MEPKRASKPEHMKIEQALQQEHVEGDPTKIFEIVYEFCKKGDIDLIKQWIKENSKRLEEQGLQKEMLFHAAAEGNQLAIFQWLSEQNPTLFKKFLEDTPFILKLAILPAPTVLDFLLAKGLDPQTANSFKQTLLHIAAQAGQEENVKILLQKEAHINAQDLSQRTPLLLAAIGGHRSTVSLLLQKNALIPSLLHRRRNHPPCSCLLRPHQPPPGFAEPPTLPKTPPRPR